MSQFYTDEDVAAITDALREASEFAQQEEDGYWVEGWTPDFARAVLEAVAPAIAARALRDFADNHVGVQTPARMAEDLHERADDIANGRI